MSETIEQTALTVIPASALPTILAADGATDILRELMDEISDFKPDGSTEKGRRACSSMARKVSIAKQDLIRLAKTLREDADKTIKGIIAEVKVIEERMDGLRDQINAPVLAWRQRCDGYEQAIEAIKEHPEWGASESAEDIKRRIAHLENYPARDWQEFAQRARDTIDIELVRARRFLAAAEKREAEAAELERLRAEEAERQRIQAEKDRQEREARIAAEAAERAKQEAEARAAQEAAEAERRAEAERQKIIREAREREEAAAERERKAKAAAELAEQNRKEAAARAEQERIAAEQKAERDRQAAVEAERKRAADEAAALRAEEERRAANQAHRKLINREALADIMVVLGQFYGEPDEKCGIAIVTAIAKGEIKHVSIRY